ncbi:hypothetical protein DQ244_07340 [Blastococcus sp. TBT05-19]|nr:hypothetical protein DQ244_07340 [Blastococcus sp. TBT05-19]
MGPGSERHILTLILIAVGAPLAAFVLQALGMTTFGDWWRSTLTLWIIGAVPWLVGVLFSSLTRTDQA